MVKLTFVAGTLEVRNLGQDSPYIPSRCLWDARSGCFRAPAVAYAEIVLGLMAQKIPYEDNARAYVELTEGPRVHREPRPYQTEAIAAWLKARGRGVVVLPTGAGKTHVATMAIEAKKRATLVVTPTLDLVRQWYDVLRTTFFRHVGIVGGGEHTIHPLTVTTYDSAHLHMDHLGNRFGLVVFDECHHLPGPSYSLAAQFCLAPYRMGLTATPERTDGRETELVDLVGPEVYRRDVTELAGEFLAGYDTVRLTVELSPEERTEYEHCRAIYRAFIVSQGIRMSSPAGFQEFIKRAARSREGLEALAAYRKQKELSLAASAKLDLVERLLLRHHTERTILFTQDNSTAYHVARRFLVPIITHQTKVRERSEILEAFSAGKFSAVVTSKVLNEGVDVPEASVAIIISGSGTVREHVQRLGRILRKKEGKMATLYEIVSANTGETYTSERRRDHVAYR